MKIPNCLLRIRLTALAALLTCSLASAADLSWTGASTSGNWSSSLNWINTEGANAIPANGDNLIFPASSQLLSTNDLASWAGGWLRLPDGGYSLYGNALTLNGLTNLSAGNTLYLPLTLGVAQTWEVPGGGSLALSNTLALGAYALALSGDGDVTLAGVISGTGSVTKSGAGNLMMAGANTHTGGLTVNSGILYADTANGSAYGCVGNGGLVVNNGCTVIARLDNALAGTGGNNAPPRYVRINSGGTITIDTRTCHLPNVVLDGGVLAATGVNNTWGSWNLDYGVSTLTNGSVSTIDGGNLALTQTGGSVFNIGAGDTVNVSSVIAHTTSAADLGLIKSGDGVLSLSTINTYTSPTTIRAGTLALAGGSIDASSTVTVLTNGVFNVQGVSYSIGTNQTLAGTGKVLGTINDINAGAILSPGGNSAAGTFFLESLGLNGNLSFNFDLANVTTVGGFTNDLLVVTNLTLSSGATNTVQFNFLAGTPVVGGVYTLIQYVNCNVSAGLVTTLASAPTRYTFTFTNDTSVNAIKVIVGGNPATLVWKGDGVSNLWDVVTTKNWLKNGTTPDLFYQADMVSFTDAGSNVPPITLVGAVQPTTISVNATNSYMLSGSGKISGSATLTKSGSGALFLNTANDYTGTTTVNGGAVNLQMAGAVAGPVTVNAGALNVNVASSLAGESTVNGGTLTVNIASGSTAANNTVNNGGNLVLNAGGSSGSVRGAVTVNAGGTLTLAAGNSLGYSGAAWVRTLNINSGLVDNVINGDNGWGLTINMTGGELRANNGINHPGSGPLFSLGGGSAINVLANATPALATGRLNLRENNTGNLMAITVADGPADPDFLVAAAITTGNASYGLSKNGPGTMTFTGTNTYSSPTVINEGTLKIGAGGFTGTIGTGNITNNATLVFNRADALTVSAPISGTGSMQNVGTGPLLLNGSNSYAGPTTISAGTLQGSGYVNSPITVQSGANLSAGGVLGTGTLSVSNATLNAGAGLVLDLSSTAATSDLIAARGTLALGTTPVTFNFLGGKPYTGGPYTIITNWVPRSGNLTYVNPSRYTAAIDESHANRIQVTFSGANANLVWKGNVNNLWNVADANWLDGGAASTYYQSDTVLFDDTGLGTPAVSLAGAMMPASVTVNSSGNYTFSGGSLAGVGALVKSGSGKLTIANDLAHTGGTTVSAGTLQIGDGSSAGSITGNVADFASLVFNRADASTCGSLISGPGTVTAAGTGTLTLLGNSTFFGGATVNAGSAVQVGNGALTDSGILGVGPVNNLGAITYNRASQITIAAPHTGNGSLAFVGTGALGQSSYSLNATNTFTGPVSLSLARLIGNLGGLSLGSPSVINVQPGSQLYAVGTSYSPNFNIPLTLAGTGWRESSGLLGALRLNGGANWAGPITLAANARITAYNDGGSNVITGTITGGANQLEVGASGGTSARLILAPAAANTFGSLMVSPGTVILGNANAVPNNVPLAMNGGTLQLNGNSRTFADFLAPAGGTIANGSGATAATITLNPAFDTIYSGTFADGGTMPLALVKNGGATLALTALSTSQGGVTVNGGVLALRNGGGNGTIRGTVTMQPGTLLLSQNNDSLGYNGGASQVTNLVLNGAALIHSPANNLTLWNNLVVNMTGGYLASTNTGGRIDFGAGASLNTYASPNASTIAGVNLFLRQANTLFTVADGGASDDLLISAPINEAAAGYGFTKNGPGRLKITGAIALTGALTVNGGSVVLGASSPMTTMAGTITVAGGATLDASAPGGLTLNANQVLQGGGTVLGSVTDGTSTVLRPGASAGTLTVGSLTLGGGGSLDMELSNVTTVGGGVNDLIQVNGDLSLNDGAPTVVNFRFLNGAPATQEYTILKYTGTLSGSSAGLTNYAGDIATFRIDTAAKAVKVSFKVPARNLVWQGDGSANAWDLDLASLNWYDGVNATNFSPLDVVRFDDTRTELNTNVSVTATVAPAGITFDSTNNYWFVGAGKITGVGSVTKNNTNTVTLGVVNDLIGPVNVNAGILALSENDTYIGATTITVANGAAFDFGGMNDNVVGRAHDFVIAGSGPDGLGALRNETYDIYEYANVSNLTLTADSVLGAGANSRWDIGPAANSKLDGQGYNLTKIGEGTINLRTQVITNLSSITVSNGTLFYENYDRTNAATAATTNYVKPGATLSTYGARTIGMPIVLDGATISSRNSTPAWIGPMRIDSASLFANNLSQVFGGVLYGAGGIRVSGGISPLTFTNNNTFTGGTILSNAPVTGTNLATAGTAALLVNTATGLGTGPVTLDCSLVTTNTITNVVRAIEFNVPGGGLVPNPIVLPSSLITNLSIQGRDTTSVFTLAGQISGGFIGLTNWFDSGTSGSLGVTRLANAANNFTVSTLRVSRGTLAITADGCLGNSANLLRLDQAAGGITGAGLRFDAAGINVAHNLLAASGTVFDLLGDNNGDGVAETANTATVSGILSGSGTIYVRGTNGTLILSGANTYTGGFELQQPVTLQFGASTNLGTGYVALKAGSTLRYTGSGSETMTRTCYDDSAALGGGTIDVLNSTAVLTWNPGAGTINQTLTKTGAGTLVLGSLGISGGLLTVNAGAMTVNSVISGSTVVAVNSGTLTLNGTNTASGPTLVNGGTLFVNGSLPTANAVTVGLGATLGGNGTINCPVTINAGAALQPGVNAIGKLTVASTLALAGMTTMEINGTTGTNDSVAGLSSVTYGGTLTVNNLGGTPAGGAKFKLFSSVGRLGTFAAVNLPALPQNLAWANLLSVDGSLQVVPTTATLTNAVVGNSLQLSWPANSGWRLLAQTNSGGINPSADWYPVAVATNSISIPIDTTQPPVFYRLVYP